MALNFEAKIREVWSTGSTWVISLNSLRSSFVILSLKLTIKMLSVNSADTCWLSVIIEKGNPSFLAAVTKSFDL